MTFSGKTVLITGASRGIGAATAHHLATLGANVVLTARSAQALEQLAADIGPQAKAIACDVSDYDQVKATVDLAVAQFGGLDILVNNASTFYPTPIDEISNDHWMKLVGSNLKGPLFLISGLKDKLKESKGSIVNITDTNLSKGTANFSIYSAAKGGLESITKGLARELAPDITVNAIAPGAMLEPPGVEWTDEQKEKVVSNIPLKRMGCEKDIANAVKFVASAKYMTGQIIKVDGGRSLS